MSILSLEKLVALILKQLCIAYMLLVSVADGGSPLIPVLVVYPHVLIGTCIRRDNNW